MARESPLPASYKVTYWNGSAFVPVANPKGLGVDANAFNSTSFDPVKTDKLRLEIVSDGTHSPGILEWKVYSSGAVPLFPPTVNAGVDRSVVLGANTYLSGSADWLLPSSPQSRSLEQALRPRSRHIRRSRLSRTPQPHSPRPASTSSNSPLSASPKAAPQS